MNKFNIFALLDSPQSSLFLLFIATFPLSFGLGMGTSLSLFWVGFSCRFHLDLVPPRLYLPDPISFLLILPPWKCMRKYDGGREMAKSTRIFQLFFERPIASTEVSNGRADEIGLAGGEIKKPWIVGSGYEEGEAQSP